MRTTSCNPRNAVGGRTDVSQFTGGKVVAQGGCDREMPMKGRDRIPNQVSDSRASSP